MDRDEDSLRKVLRDLRLTQDSPPNVPISQRSVPKIPLIRNLSPIPPQPPRYFSINVRQIVEITDLNELEKQVQSFEIEFKLKRLFEGTSADAYFYFDNIIEKYKKESETSLRALLGPLTLNLKTQNIRRLQQLILTEDWSKIERVFLLLISQEVPPGKAPLYIGERYLLIMVYNKLPEGRWVAVYSSPLVENKVNNILESLRKRIFSQKQRIKETSKESELQKSEKLSFFLNLSPGEEIFILDTNILYDNHDFCKFNLSQTTHSIVLTFPVLQELDKLKLSRGGGNKAQAIVNSIESLDIQNHNEGRLICKKKNIRMFIFIFEPEQSSYLQGFRNTIEDDRIVMTAKSIQGANPQNKVVLVSKDPGLRLKAKAIEIETLRFSREKHIRGIN